MARGGGRSSGAPGVVIIGLTEFRRELRKMSRDLPREMASIHREVARETATIAKAAAPSGVKSGIRGRGNQQGAFIDVGTSPVRTLGVIMGARKRFGWYAHPRYAQSTGRQFEEWVGNQWDPGDSVGKPYYIGDAINQRLDRIMDVMGDRVEELARRAFPERF